MPAGSAAPATKNVLSTTEQRPARDARRRRVPAGRRGAAAGCWRLGPDQTRPAREHRGERLRIALVDERDLEAALLRQRVGDAPGAAVAVVRKHDEVARAAAGSTSVTAAMPVAVTTTPAPPSSAASAPAPVRRASGCRCACSRSALLLEAREREVRRQHERRRHRAVHGSVAMPARTALVSAARLTTAPPAGRRRPARDPSGTHRAHASSAVRDAGAAPAAERELAPSAGGTSWSPTNASSDVGVVTVSHRWVRVDRAVEAQELLGVPALREVVAARVEPVLHRQAHRVAVAARRAFEAFAQFAGRAVGRQRARARAAARRRCCRCARRVRRCHAAPRATHSPAGGCGAPPRSATSQPTRVGAWAAACSATMPP